jgi:para-aminobenzoate synthetase/4-amino-4-deoxychorismate lyase
MKREPRVRLDFPVSGNGNAPRLFDGLERVIVATTLEEVLPALKAVEAAVAQGRHAAGFISYEAAGGLNPDLVTRPPGDLPLLWFGIFRHRLLEPPAGNAGSGSTTMAPPSGWQESLDADRYATAIAAIRDRIADGETYQVNFTMRIAFQLSGDAEAWHRELCRSQPTPYGAYIDTGTCRILSASPELFFRLDGDLITTRPMKGTAPRGRWSDEDEEFRLSLAASAKERAENLMIVDLLRNDLGRVAATGSVAVPSLFATETLPTLHQMTSTVTARLESGTTITDIFRALFPCGSVTGAPKRRTMEIIAHLEEQPRGVYTGCIGYISPGKRACFSVAIRTAVIRDDGRGELGVGSGITWDSLPDAEYGECLAKSRFARESRQHFRLIESLLREEGTGYFLRERHLARLARSARHFGFSFDPATTARHLEAFGTELTGSHKVRLLLSRDGQVHLEAAPLSVDPAGVPLPVAMASAAVDSRDPFLYHKTERREFYQAELSRRPDCTDLLFVNERGEVTEGGNHNLVLLLDGKLVTPPLASGLLPGVFREELLEGGIISERLLTPADVRRADEVWLINSVRRWRRASLLGTSTAAAL